MVLPRFEHSIDINVKTFSPCLLRGSYNTSQLDISTIRALRQPLPDGMRSANRGIQIPESTRYLEASSTFR